MTTNPYAEAVEAAARAIGSRASCEHERAWIDAPARRYENCFDCDGRAAVAAAVGPLLAPVRALADHLALTAPSLNRGKACTGANCGACRQAAAARRIREALDAIEAGATSEGGRDE